MHVGCSCFMFYVFVHFNFFVVCVSQRVACRVSRVAARGGSGSGSKLQAKRPASASVPLSSLAHLQLQFPPICHPVTNNNADKQTKESPESLLPRQALARTMKAFLQSPPNSAPRIPPTQSHTPLPQLPTVSAQPLTAPPQPPTAPLTAPPTSSAAPAAPHPTTAPPAPTQ